MFTGAQSLRRSRGHIKNMDLESSCLLPMNQETGLLAHILIAFPPHHHFVEHQL